MDSAFSSPYSSSTLELFARQEVSVPKANLLCPRPLAHDPGVPLSKDGTLTFYELMVYITGPCLGLTVIITYYHSWRHLHRWTAPQEQRQILRIINLPVAYALFNFLAILFTIDYLYIEPIAQVYEAFCVAALFFLVLEYVCPDGTDREKYFNNLENRDRKGTITSGGSLKWFQRTWSSVLQYPLLKTILIIVQIVTQYFGDYCESNWSPKYAHLWLQLADYLFIGGALAATLRFARRLRPEVAPIHKLRPKLWSVIGILIFQILQDLIFHVFNGKLFEPTEKVTYNDINFGIASFMTCVESVVFSLIFLWSFSSSEYREGARLDRLGRAPAKRQNTFKAIFEALNLSDVIAGTVLAFQMLFMRVRSRYGGRSMGQQQYQQERYYQRPLTPPETSYGASQLQQYPNQRYDVQDSEQQAYLEPLAARGENPGRVSYGGGRESRDGYDNDNETHGTTYSQGYARPST